MKNDLISREALKKAIKEDLAEGDNSVNLEYCNAMETALDIIDNAPTIEPFERIGSICEENCGYRPQGEWIKEDDEHLKGWYRCSECGRRVEDLTDDVVIHAGCEDYTIADIYPYCHCGAKMKIGKLFHVEHTTRGEEQ